MSYRSGPVVPGLVLGFLLASVLEASAGAPGPSPAGGSGATSLVVESGVGADGAGTRRWLEVVRFFHDEDSHRALASVRKPLTEAEARWAALIRRRAPAWERRTEALRVPFGPTEPPPSVLILLGNFGSEDAFAPEDATVAFGLHRLQSNYGDATDSGNEARIDRFFDHEFTHLLHKAWRRDHDPKIETPLERALWVCLKEGIGNYRSLYEKWVRDGELTAHARSVLEDLEPIFAQRISALEHANEEEAPALMKNLSMGPFQKKWGALTVALWLAQEARGDDRRLRPWVEAGPWGVVELARRYLPEDLARGLPKPPEG